MLHRSGCADSGQCTDGFGPHGWFFTRGIRQALQRCRKLLTRNAQSCLAPHASTLHFTSADIAWAMGSFCALNRKPFDAGLLLKQFPPPYTSDSFIHAARALGFRVRRQDCDAAKLFDLKLPCLVVLEAPLWREGVGVQDQLHDEPEPATHRPAIVVQITDDTVTLFEAGSNQPLTLPRAEFAARYAGTAFQLAPENEAVKDPDGALAAQKAFGFRWFVPELMKHRRIWRDVLAASLIIQLLALGTPLFTQVIIDKVIVHYTQSTLIVIGIGMAVFMLFSALLGWVRQYMVLHTGNRVDAVLGAAVFDHLFKLPPRYFEHRPTGVITARLQGVE